MLFIDTVIRRDRWATVPKAKVEEENRIHKHGLAAGPASKQNKTHRGHEMSLCTRNDSRVCFSSSVMSKILNINVLRNPGKI